MRGVLNHLEVIHAGQSSDAGHVHNLPAVVDRHNGHNLFTPRPCLFDTPVRILHVQVEIILPTIDQQRFGVEVANHFGGRGERHRRHHNGIAGLDADRFESQMQRRSARIERDRVLLIHIGGKLLLEAFGLRPSSEPAGFQGIDNFFDFGVADAGLVEWNFHIQFLLNVPNDELFPLLRNTKSKIPRRNP
jgi:hypothetical protein